MWEKKHTIFTHMMNYTIQHHCFAHRNDCHTEKLNHFSLSKSYHIENIFNVKHLSQKNCHFFDLANRFSIHSPLKSYGSKLADQNTHNKNLMKGKNIVSVLVGFVFSTNTETITRHTGKSQTKSHKQVAPIQPTPNENEVYTGTHTPTTYTVNGVCVCARKWYIIWWRKEKKWMNTTKISR